MLYVIVGMGAFCGGFITAITVVVVLAGRGEPRPLA